MGERVCGCGCGCEGVSVCAVFKGHVVAHHFS